MINTTTLTGWLTADPIQRCTPKGEQRLCFMLHTKDSHGLEVEVACFVDVIGLALRVEPLLMPGRGIVVQGEMTQREVEVAGRTKWIAREVRVLGCEVPNRGALAQPKTEAAPV